MEDPQIHFAVEKKKSSAILPEYQRQIGNQRLVRSNIS